MRFTTKINVKYYSLSFLFFLFLCLQQLQGQSSVPNITTFKLLSTAQQIQAIHDFQLYNLDSTNFIKTHKALSAIAEEKEDWRMKWDLKYNYFLQRGNMKLTSQDNINLLINLITIANEHDFQHGKIVAQHYLVFEEYYAGKRPLGALYTHILKEAEMLEVMGYQLFMDYRLSWLLYHNAKFLYELDDTEKALHLFQIAEQHTAATADNSQVYILILNHLQSIFQNKNQLDKALQYAKKIIEFSQNPPPNNHVGKAFYQQWEGLASLDVAAMLVDQGKFAESELFAQTGYELSKAKGQPNRAELRAEYDALHVLAAIMLKQNQLEKASPLIERLDTLYEEIGGDYENYFNNIQYFEVRAQYHEMRNEFAEAINYSKIITPLKDSLERRNNARQLEQLKQRIDAEKYTDKIQLIEQEKELQKWLRNAALLGLLLVSLLAYLYFRKLHKQRQKRIRDLKKAETELAALTQNFREKSKMADGLRLELNKIAESGNRSEYLEQLSHSTILTDQDWLDFRVLFEKVHPGFIQQKTNTHPNLTQGELRYLVLDKLQLTTTEMANMLGVSNGAIRQARARLRKKIS